MSRLTEIDALADKLFLKVWNEFEDNIASPELKFPGVYVIAYSHKNL
jgi:hypothetical protein